MTKKKTLLNEGTVRQFMKLANLKPLASDFVESLYEKKEGDNARLATALGANKDDKEDDDTEQSEEDREHESEGEEKAHGKPKYSGNKSSSQTNEVVEVDLAEEFEVEAEVEAEEEIEEPEEPAIEDPEPEGGLEDEVSITPEEADTIIGLADKLAAAKGEESVEDFDDEIDAEEEIEDVAGIEDAEATVMAEEDDTLDVNRMVNKIAENVTKRLKALATKSKRPKQAKQASRRRLKRK